MNRVENTKQYTRADFLRLAIGAALITTSCARQPVPTGSPQVDVGIRRELGIWTQEQVETFAGAMMGNSEFNNIAYAGSILLDNQQGKPSFSKNGSIFSDEKAKVVTVDKIDPADSGMNVLQVAPVGAIIKVSDQKINANLRSLTGGPDLRMSAPASLQFKEIRIDGVVTRNYPDFLMHFLVAKEVLSAQAFDMVAKYVMANTLYPDYERPKDERIRKAVETSAINSGFGRVPTSFMADLWGHYLLLPDYLKAIEQGKFSQDELDGDILRVFKIANDNFQKAGILVKDQDGKYKWTEDSKKFYDTWIDFSVAGYNALHR
ncbi:hypothetical protein HY383_04065 [Candidatus Daviesbacteria bacterium]|nr:hypothetical protein [Candidatus Daviesbacteria bacterium]